MLASLLALVLMLALLTPFRPPAQVLSENTWGAGTPSATWITAFATMRPWWNLHVPEPIILTPSGGLEPLVVIPRDEIRARPRSTVLPVRSIGYDALLGMVTAVRSIGTPSVVYDFALFVRMQQIALVLVWALVPFAVFAISSRRQLAWTVALYVPVFLVTLLAKPTKDIFLSQGIIDSALASPMALVAIPALCVSVWVSRQPFARWHVAVWLAIGLVLGYAALVRGELLLVLLTAFALLGLALVREGARRVLKLAAVGLVMLAVPVGYGLANRAVLGHFVPLRMQSGQNLYQPIGQYPNPYGIEYSDVWAEQHLRDRGIEYVSVEADRYFTDEYFRLMRADPMLFLTNFVRRLTAIKLSLSIVNVWTLPLVLLGLVYQLRRSPDSIVLCVPWILLVSFLVVCAWLNDAPRIIAPLHFLTNSAMAIGLTVALRGWVDRRFLSREL